MATAKRVTPVTLALAAVIVLAVGFVAGAQYEKHAGSDNESEQTANLPTGAQGQRGQGQNGQGQNGDAANQPTFGEVASKDGNTLTVTDQSGNTVKVKLNGNAEITRSAESSAGAIRPGDTVIVQGTKSSNGTITASTVRATEEGATMGGPGGGGFPGGAPPDGAVPPNGGGQPPSGFTPPGG